MLNRNMYLNQKEQKELAVKKSKNGKGIFVRKNFKSGQAVFQFAGKIITCDVDEDVGDDVRSNTIRFDEDRFISPNGRIGDFLNHSCDPNAKVVKRENKLLVVAIRPILKDEEIFIDYSTVTAADDIWTMRCKCGSSNCRGVVKQFQKLSKKIQEAYIEQGIIPSYILNI